MFSLDEIVSEQSNKEDDILLTFQTYHILEFGYKLRNKPNKWNTINVLDTISEQERIKKNDAAENIINTIIGSNLVPAYPIFLLTILQTIEMGQPHVFKQSAYGHYYQVLITSSLGKIVKSNDETTKIT